MGFDRCAWDHGCGQREKCREGEGDGWGGEDVMLVIEMLRAFCCWLCTRRTGQVEKAWR